MASQSGRELIKAVIKRTLSVKGWGSSFLKNVEVISADNGNCVAEFTVGEEHLNDGGTLHGGCTSTLVDSISTYALMTKVIDGKNVHPGVSVDLHITLLKAAFPGDVIVIDAKTIRAGRTLAFLKVDLKKKNEGAVIALGSHTKFIGFS
ncbi:acyl-coenzyme A thioesterase 13-like [Chelonus insularis]|uniref:acyl-coenzyme A thioesterase 13-like n=1 Tax=Chelonus insularis TaxID=460826 RepID=UPI00158A543E|nr:acyl-coenzyme A thioesterase 13-like [Chelonus insularis]